MKRLLSTITVIAGVIPMTQAEEVILDFEAVASAVVGTPFGVTVPRLTLVTGHFVYNTATIDDNPSAERGNYPHNGTGGFRARFLGHQIDGSANPTLEVENIPVGGASIDTFRILDSHDSMRFNGTAESSIVLSLSITDSSGAAFSSDQLPAEFPLAINQSGIGPNFPHTFSLADEMGTLLLRFNWLRQRSVPPLRITEIAFEGGVPFLAFQSNPGTTYTIEASTDLVGWQVLDANFPDDGYQTDFFDTEITTRHGGLPERLYYRVRENP